jgi:pheromone shutdown protein TraB
MNIAMRRQLARLPFEEKIRKVGQLIKLSATVKSSRVREETPITQPPTQTRRRIAEGIIESKP